MLFIFFAEYCKSYKSKNIEMWKDKCIHRFVRKTWIKNSLGNPSAKGEKVLILDSI
jgi:hypothetical protein